MREVTCETARQYLIDTQRLADTAAVQCRRLTGGVSNEVLLVETDVPGLERFVLKQARPQLRTPQQWHCTVERIWREIAVLRCYGELAPSGTIPEILFEDREQFLFAMSAAPEGHTVWRDDLLAGRIDLALGEHAGRLLAAIHAGTWRDAGLEGTLGNRSIFRQLRIEPYYETVADRFPHDRPAFKRLIESVWSHPLALVHADFSPKNMLVFQGRLMLVDFETGHFGDPAFDLGFFLAHLVLKTLFHAAAPELLFKLSEHFLATYEGQMHTIASRDELTALRSRASLNLGGCLWSRLDGKSQVDYLSDACRRDAARALARSLLAEPCDEWSQVLVRVAATVAQVRRSLHE